MHHDNLNSDDVLARSAGTTQRPSDEIQRHRFTAGRLLRLCLKELRETLRDRRTIVTLVLMPLLVYPLLSVLFNKLLSLSRDSGGQYECRVGIEAPRKEDEALFQKYFQLAEGIWRIKQPPQRPPENEQQSTSGGQTRPAAGPTIQWWMGKNLETQVANGEIDVAVFVTRIPSSRGPQPSRALRVQLLYRESSALSKAGLEYLERRLHAFNEQYLLERLQTAGVRARVPLVNEVRGIRDTRPAVSLTTLIPLILILMTITGAVYPAIDLTAGERERGTLEALMAAPVPRLSLLTAKYVAVVTVALLTAVANLFAMTVTLVSTGLGEAIFGVPGFPAVLISQVFALLILFAAFFSAILLAVTSFARSFKEAQAYLIPLMLLSLAPGTISLMPDLQFSGFFSVVPLVNIVLLARDLMEGHVDPALATIAVASTAIYAVAAIALAARIFGTDAILYGSQASWSDLLGRRGKHRQAPSVSGAMLSLAVLFPLYFLLASSLPRFQWLTISSRLILAGLITVFLFAVLPVALAVAQRVRLSPAFRVYPSSILAFLAATVLGLTLWPLAHEVFMFNRLLGFNTLSVERIQDVQKLLEQFQQLSPALILTTLALIPAICEELFFRAYLVGALRQRFSAASTIVLTALLFGVFHVVVTSALSVERLLPSMFLGLVLGWVCERSGSVLPGMLLHATHNGLLLLIGIYRDQLSARGWGVEEREHLSFAWIAISTVCVLSAVAVLYWSTRGRERVRPISGGNDSA